MKMATRCAALKAFWIMVGLAAMMTTTLAPMTALAGQEVTLIGLEASTFSVNDNRIKMVHPGF